MLNDFLQRLRMQSIFNPATPPTYQGSYNTSFAPLAAEPPDDTEEYDPAKRMTELYHPETKNIDAFNQLASQYPTMAQPGKLRKIGSVALATLGDYFGPQGSGKMAFNEMMGFGPHDRAVADWKNKLAPLEDAANYERNMNSQNRMFATSTVTSEQRQSKDAAAAKNAEKKTAISQQLADIQKFKAENPNLKIVAPKGGNIQAIDPRTGQVVRDLGSAGTLTDEQRIGLEQKGAIEKIEKQGEETRATNAAKGWAIGTIPDPNDPTKTIGVRYNVDTGAIEPIKFGGKGTAITPTTGKSGNANQASDNLKQKAQETLDALNEIMDEKGNLTGPAQSAVGKSRMLGLQYIPGTDALAGDAAINRLKSLLIVDLIGEMKAQSKTGATGFGQLNMKELGVLENAASKLNAKLDEPTFLAEVKRIKERLQKILMDGTPTDKGANNGGKKTAAELIAQYGGKQ